MGFRFDTVSVAKPQVMVSLNESVNGLEATKFAGTVQANIGTTGTLSLIGSVSAAGLTLTMRLMNVTTAAWATAAVTIVDVTDTLVTTPVTMGSVAQMYRLQLSLSGGAGVDTEIGIVGSAIITA